MTLTERHARLTQIVIRLDEMAAAFMQLDREVRDLLRAEFEASAARSATHPARRRLPMIRRRERP